MLPKISELAGLCTCYTNHSLRVTAATRMFAAGVPDKVIAEFTVPRTPMALHQYVHTSVDQVKASGFAVSGNAPNDRKPLVAVENPKVDMEDKKPDSDTLQQSVPTFLGNLTNCTINIKL